MVNKNTIIQRIFLIIFVNFVLIPMLGICNVNAVEKDDNMNQTKFSYTQLSKLSGKTLFFGHQSVGYNIIDGVYRIITHSHSINFKIVQIKSPSDFNSADKGTLFHATIGKNFDPHSKVDAFASWMDHGIGGNVDIAFMKFCFVDIGTQTDIKELFEYYKKTMAELKHKYPSTTFVHFTVPLLSEKVGYAKWKYKLKGIVKKILNKNEFYENYNKYTFNEMMRSEYRGKEPVFDLAAIESTYPDGSRSISIDSGKQIESMVPAYTNDGGHLNTKGQDIVAKKILSFLVTLL